MKITLETYQIGTEKEIVEFLSKVFEETYSLDLWYWKYKEHKLGTYTAIARIEGKIVGHYGGLPKRVYYKGKYGLSSLICDVAVDKRYRASFTKKGIFYHLFYKFMKEYVHEDIEKRTFILGYGFPTDKARRLALRLGVYEDVEKVAEFLINFNRVSFFDKRIFYIRNLGDNFPLVDKLWEDMMRSLMEIFGKDFIINIRNSDFLKWRIKQPNAKFQVKVVYKFFKPVAIFLIRTDKDIPYLYDYIGNLREVGKYLKILIAKNNYKHLKARFPMWIKNFLVDINYSILDTNTYLVANRITGPRANEIKGRFFYTYADEDV